MNFIDLANRAKQAFLILIGKAVDSKIAVQPDMYNSIELWSAMYEGKAPWQNENVPSLGLASAVASEAARLITLEQKTEVTGSKRADYLNEQLQPFLANLRYYTEYGCAKGGIAFKPYVADENIGFDAVQADRFFPTEYDSAGNITGAVFVDRMRKGNVFYTRLEKHEKTKSGVKISNKAYVSRDENTLGDNIPLKNVEEWSGIAPEAEISNVDRPLFAYFKVAQANMIDYSSPLGVSIYATAVDRIKDADTQYGRLLWEFEGGELAVDADFSVLKPDKRKGYVAPKGQDRLFRVHNFDDDKNKTLSVFSPQLRDESILNGLNAILRRIEFNCGLAYGTLSNTEDVAKTATEIKASRQRSYTMVSDNQKSLEKAIDDLIYAMDVWATIAKLAPQGNYTVNYQWDDSILTDTETEQQIRMQEVQAGLLKPEAYLMWRYGIEDEEEARKLLPTMNSLTEDNNA